MKISENTPVSMPMKNLLSIVSACLVGAWFAFTVVERLNVIETEQKLMLSDLEAANEFIVGVPKGNMVSPQIQELFMLVEHMAGLIESMDEELKGMRNNKINIDFLKEQVLKLQEDVEKLIRNGSGH